MILSDVLLCQVWSYYFSGLTSYYSMSDIQELGKGELFVAMSEHIGKSCVLGW